MKRVRLAALMLMTTALMAAGVVAAVATPAPAIAPRPVAPGNATSAQFEPAVNCGCHSTLLEEWSVSMHGKALDDPLFKAKVEEGDKAMGGQLAPFCLSCHGPNATMAGEFVKGATLSAAGKQGVTCSFCHQVFGLKPGTPGNVSQLVAPNGTRRAQLTDPAAPHPATYSELHTKAEFCGACHNVNHPVNGMHLESTFSEWEASPYAEQGVVCQDCHMSRTAGEIGPSTGVAAAGARERDNIFHMRFVGANVGQGPADEATAMLQGAADMKLEAPEIIEPGKATTVTVSITNKGAGHYLPTGLTEVRQMWLEVYAVGADGGKTTVGERRFGTILKDAKGKYPVEIWDAVAVQSDDRIPPQETVTAEYAFEMPAAADSATLTAELLYRSAPDEMAQKAGVNNPTTRMNVAEKQVFASAEAQRQAAQEQAHSDDASDQLGLIVALAGLIIVAALVVVFAVRSRKAA